MSITKDDILSALRRIEMPDGGDLVARDLIRAVQVQGAAVQFIIEAPTPDIAARMEPVRAAAEAAVAGLAGVDQVRVCLLYTSDAADDLVSV